ncbi:MAG: antirestriction protein [Pseudomonadota bacterium]
MSVWSFCLFALNALIERNQSAKLVDAYYHLRDFEASHDHNKKIMTFLD